MNTEGNRVFSHFSRRAAPFTWLIYDVFLLLILLSAMLAYQDLDDEMRRLVRLHFVHSVTVFLISGCHLLSFNRHVDGRQLLRLNDPDTPYLQFPAWRSYGFLLLKVIAAIAFVSFAFTRGYIA